ncbi:MAG: ABC transporter substrate-binding protein [Sphingomonas bacterium]|nr:ABC transporter substrate-binding protein [Sphingomonas bacterium]
MARHTKPVIMAIAALLALGGCRDRNTDALDVMVIGAAPLTLADPADGPLTPAQQLLIGNVAQGLVRFDARGQIEPGLAERWNVSDDGLSYVFRLSTGKWPDGRSILARDVARLLNRTLRPASRNASKDMLGAVVEVVAMTDRVIEIRLSAPRPNLLQLLAQPDFALTREGLGTGPFQPVERTRPRAAIALVFVSQVIDGPDKRELVDLAVAPAPRAIAGFASGEVDLVLGGTFDDLPLVRRAKIARSAVRFDPVAGLFGLVPARRGGPLADRELRSLLNRAIDRDALVAALAVPGLAPRATLLQAGLEGLSPPAHPGWAAVPLAERQPQLAAEVRTMVGTNEALTLAIELPAGPGATILLDRLAADWGAIGIKLVRADKGVPADLTLVDTVAPSASPAWFVRSFRCTVRPACSIEADQAMDSARAATISDQRAALIREASRLLEEESVFLPLAAPVRWSLVGARIEGFAENIVARHPLTGLNDRLRREGQ